MNIPFYFTNSEDVRNITELCEIYTEISNEESMLLTPYQIKESLKCLKNRVMLTQEQAIGVISILTLIIISVDAFPFVSSEQIHNCKIALLKIITIHLHQIDEDIFIDNCQMFKYATVTLSSLDIKELNENEKRTLQYLKTLNA